MSKKAHTPGPWRIERGKKYGDFLIWSAHGETEVSSHWIATLKCESCPAHEEGNARLIAAAPDLLEALEACHKALNSIVDPKDSAETSIQGSYEMCEKAEAIARAALSKATGGE